MAKRNAWSVSRTEGNLSSIAMVNALNKHIKKKEARKEPVD
jgi:predicted naringenin-chalcone synthase